MTTTPAHEASDLYICALALYRAVLEAAQTESARLNEALRQNAFRLLQHCACATGAATGSARKRSRHYAQLATTKLYACVDAAWYEGEITDSQRQRLRERLLFVNASMDLDPAVPTRDELATPSAFSEIEDQFEGDAAPDSDSSFDDIGCDHSTLRAPPGCAEDARERDECSAHDHGAVGQDTIGAAVDLNPTNAAWLKPR